MKGGILYPFRGVALLLRGVALLLLLSFSLFACGGQSEDISPDEYKEFDGAHADNSRRIESLKAKLYEDPENFGLLAALGDVYFESQRFEEAIREYDKALKINPTSADCLNDKGLALFYTGQSDAALESINKSIEADPVYVHPRLSKGFMLMTLGRYEEAIEPLNKVKELDPTGKMGIEADNFLAQIKAMQGQS